jgi:hypothetical protein
MHLKRSVHVPLHTRYESWSKYQLAKTQAQHGAAGP